VSNIADIIASTVAAAQSASSTQHTQTVDRVQRACNALDSWYDAGTSALYARDGRRQYVRYSKELLALRLVTQGLDKTKRKGEDMSEVDRAIVTIATDRVVDYCGPLAGHTQGAISSGGRMVLVTEDPTIIEPCEGDWNLLRSFLHGLLGDDQIDYFHGWMAFAVRQYSERRHMPAQVLVFAGPAGCGKTLVQEVVTAAIGGRAAKPAQYLQGGTPFNADLFSAEHLVMDDEAVEGSFQKRQHVAGRLKELLFSARQRCHAKGRTPVELRPLWRMTMSLNDAPEDLDALPVLREGVDDKLIICKCFSGAIPEWVNDPARDLRGELLACLPAYLHWLRSYVVPESIRDPRFGVRAYQHPELRAEIAANSPEGVMLELIDTVIWDGGDYDGVVRLSVASGEGVRTTGAALWRALTSSGDTGVALQARSLMRSPRTAGTYLSRLARSHPTRVERGRLHEGVQQWVLKKI
jgi:DNA polymerase III delta prime subunit